MVDLQDAALSPPYPARRMGQARSRADLEPTLLLRAGVLPRRFYSTAFFSSWRAALQLPSHHRAEADEGAPAPACSRRILLAMDDGDIILSSSRRHENLPDEKDMSMVFIKFARRFSRYEQTAEEEEELFYPCPL